MLAKFHEALEHAVVAATRHASLAGLTFATWLLMILEGREGVEQRDAARERLMQALPRDKLAELRLADFLPIEWEVVQPDP